jgi:2-amino-4-hydroxy-6-hydroxymethyldihydropteridine diphosphokinase
MPTDQPHPEVAPLQPDTHVESQSSSPGIHSAWIGLGANLGDAAATLRQALQEIDHSPGIHSVSCSPFYQSDPVDASGPVFVNAVAQIQTSLSPMELLDLLQKIELAHGRKRPYRNAPRTLDLDILLFGDQKIETARLTIPHPRMHERAFVLRPLLDLNPVMMLPQGSVKELLAACDGQRLWKA